MHDLLALGDLLAVAEIVLRPHADLAQHEFELRAVEIAVGALEGGVLGGQLGEAILGQAEVHLARLLVQQRSRHHLAQHLLVEAEGLRLLARDRRAELLRQKLNLAVIGKPVVEHGYGRLSGGQHMVAHAAEDRAGNAPDREAEHEKTEQKLDQKGTGSAAQG